MDFMMKASFSLKYMYKACLTVLYNLYADEFFKKGGKYYQQERKTLIFLITNSFPPDKYLFDILIAIDF